MTTEQRSVVPPPGSPAGPLSRNAPLKGPFLAGLALCALAGSAGAAELRGLHLSAAPDGAQLVIDLSERVTPTIFQLKGPARAVIDLAGTHLGGGVTEPRAAGFVTAVRLGRQAGGVLRVVLQLSGPKAVHADWAGRQLIINLGTPLARAAAPRQADVDADADADSAATASATAVPDASAAALPEAGPHRVTAVHAPTPGERDIIVAVDAGHGGVDPGAIGHGGTREKDVTLAIARRLAARISSEPGMRAVLTRDTDEFLELRERIRRARASRADMFISVHADASLNREAAGASVYVLSEKGATNEAARWLAERQNAADLLGGVKLDNKNATLASVLLDLSQTATISSSITAAGQVLGSLDGVGELSRSQVQQAGFVVLKSPDIPSMLVETAYISNPLEESKLRRPAQQQRLAEAIFAGVRHYFLTSPPEGTRFAADSGHGGIAATRTATP